MSELLARWRRHTPASRQAQVMMLNRDKLRPLTLQLLLPLSPLLLFWVFLLEKY